VNNRNPNTSAQLGQILAYLHGRGREGATTADICRACGTLNAATCVSELRHAGYQVVCKRQGTNDQGRKIYRYVLL
jgi:hypothetical protein